MTERYDIHAPPLVLRQFLATPSSHREWQRAKQRIIDQWPQIAEHLKQRNWETISWALCVYDAGGKDVMLMGYKYGRPVGVDIGELLGPECR